MPISENRGSTPLASTNVYAIIQARMNSARLPGKVMLEAAGKPLLEHLIERLKQVKLLDGIILATTIGRADNVLWDVAVANNIVPFGWNEENDVLTRVLEAAKHSGVNVIVQVTADNPLLDPAIVDRVVYVYIHGNYDYVSNMLYPSYPIGMNVDIFSTEILEDASNRTSDPVDREHVSLYIYSNPQRYKLANVRPPHRLNQRRIRLTVDEPDDYELVRTIFERLYPENPAFTLGDILDLMRDDPALAEINRHVEQKCPR